MNGLKNRFGLVALACAVVSLVAVAPAWAQTNSSAEQPKVVVAHTNHLKATVLGVDYQNREVVLQSTNGQLARFAVSDKIKNFPQIRQGDEVNVNYYESVAYAVVKPGELPATSRTDGLAATREPGQKPGGASVSIGSTTATIEDIDRETRHVTLKGANGETVKVYVDPSVGNLQRIKTGDTVSITYTKAIAVSVENPEDSSTTTNVAPQ
jgi:Cu/Ag efflux protein CusF